MKLTIPTYILTGEEAFQLAKRTPDECLVRSPHIDPNQPYVLKAEDIERHHLNKWQKIFSGSTLEM